MKAYSTVESALRCKVGKHKYGFKGMLNKAVKSGLVNDSGFKGLRNTASSSNDYSLILVESIPALRNELSHGSNMLHKNSLMTLEICCELINQLFTNEANKTISIG